MTQYRKKPTVVDAEQYREGQPWPRGLCEDIYCSASPVAHMHLSTGVAFLNDGDWVASQKIGERIDRWPIQRDTFAATYEALGALGEPPAPTQAWDYADLAKRLAATPDPNRDPAYEDTYEIITQHRACKCGHGQNEHHDAPDPAPVPDPSFCEGCVEEKPQDEMGGASV